MGGHPAPGRPGQFVVVGQLRVWAGEGETGAKTGSLAHAQGVVDALGLGLSPLERERQQAAVARLWAHQGAEVGATAGVENLLDGGVLLELIGQGQAVAIELQHPLRDITAGLLQGDGIGIAEHSGGVHSGQEPITPGGVGADHQAAGHHIAATRKALGQGGEDQIGVGQGIQVDGGPDGVVGDHRDAAGMGEVADGRQVHAAEQRIARQLDNHRSGFQPIQGRLHIREVLALEEVATVEHHLWLLEHIHIGKAQLQGGASGSDGLYGLKRRVQGRHPRWVQADAGAADPMHGPQPLLERASGCVARFGIGPRLLLEGDRGLP